MEGESSVVKLYFEIRC